ncbi:MAG: DUF4474 domain-containing protein [Clostridiaceae bacterium]|nr:DUF4474 domain-containing protein [Clostridiaceae bacterium]
MLTALNVVCLYPWTLILLMFISAVLGMFYPKIHRYVAAWIIQRKNKLLCDQYKELTREYDNSMDKLKAIQEKAPQMIVKALKIGKTRELFNKHERIKKYLK